MKGKTTTPHVNKHTGNVVLSGRPTPVTKLYVGLGPGAVTAATNATPIVLTSVEHELSSSMRVTVSGVLGNTAANGTFTVTRVDEDTFSLNGSTGNGAYVSGGIWTQRRDSLIPQPYKTPYGGSHYPAPVK